MRRVFISASKTKSSLMLLLVLRRSRFEEGNEQNLIASFTSEIVMQPFFQPVSSLRVFFPSFPLVCHHLERNKIPTELPSQLNWLESFLFPTTHFFFSRERETKQLDCTTTYTNHSLFSEEQEENVVQMTSLREISKKDINKKKMREGFCFHK